MIRNKRNERLEKSKPYFCEILKYGLVSSSSVVCLKGNPEGKWLLKTEPCSFLLLLYGAKEFQQQVPSHY